MCEPSASCQVPLSVPGEPMSGQSASASFSSEITRRTCGADPGSGADPLPPPRMFTGAGVIVPSSTARWSAAVSRCPITRRTSATYTGSAGASYTHRGPRTEWSTVPTRAPSAPGSSSPR